MSGIDLCMEYRWVSDWHGKYRVQNNIYTMPPLKNGVAALTIIEAKAHCPRCHLNQLTSSYFVCESVVDYLDFQKTVLGKNQMISNLSLFGVDENGNRVQYKTPMQSAVPE